LVEVVEHLALVRQVRAILAEGPFDVPGGEHAVWLVQSDIRVGVDPHAADAFPAVDQDDLLIARQITAGREQRVNSGDAGSHDADVTGFHRHGWLGFEHRYPLVAVPPPDVAQECHCRSTLRRGIG
jgi:hypothetical protein